MLPGAIFRLLTKVGTVSGFKPRFQVQIIWPTRSHGGYCILNRGVKPPLEFDHYGLQVGIAGIRY
jgi:hypothetical protein